jgi:hypothetical protein
MRKIGLTVLWGLAVLLAGCEKEESLKGSGEMVAVNISLGGIFYSGNETVMRGDVEEEETVSVAFGGGVIYVYNDKKKYGGGDAGRGRAAGGWREGASGCVSRGYGEGVGGIYGEIGGRWCRKMGRGLRWRKGSIRL